MKRAGMRRDEEGWAGMGRDEMGWYDMASPPRPPVQCDRRGKLEPSQPIFFIAALSVMCLVYLEMCCILCTQSCSMIDSGFWDPAF